MAQSNRSPKNFKVSIRPSTISHISFPEEDELISLIHQLDLLDDPAADLGSETQVERLSNSKKKDISRSLIRTDRRTLNQQKHEKSLRRQLEKERRAMKYLSVEPEEQIEFQYADQRQIATIEPPFSLSKLKDICGRLFNLPKTQIELFLDSHMVDDSLLSTVSFDDLVSLRIEFCSVEIPPRIGQEVSTLRLPILEDSVKNELLAAIEGSSVVVLVGDTGCGKSTQVPQILFDYSSSEVNIVCTQPRRIAAISIAERVAAERNQPCGELVGYHVRLQSNFDRQTRILYCTTGVLLMRLQDPSYLKTITHLIIDEVHERQIETDFLMALIRHKMKDFPHLKLILMSATIQSQLIMSYFSPCPLVSVSGRAFSVEEYYIDDVHSLVRSGQLIQAGLLPPSTNEDSIQTLRDKKYCRVSEDLVVEFTIRLIQRENYRRSEEVSAAGDTILIFLPGIQVIEKVHRLFRSRQVLSSLRATIFILHSTLSPAQQRKVFHPTPCGEWKIVLSTNIAESSVTIDDVTHVIDTGRDVSTLPQAHLGLVRELRYNPSCQLSTLSTTQCSKASLTQRKGRAGRVRDGTCWRLFPKEWMTNGSLEEYPTSEIRRISLEDACLKCLFLNLGNPEEFLSTCLEPPSPEQVQTALQLLKTVGAICQSTMPPIDYDITPLGIHLAQLPLDIKLGKMLIYACLFNCVDPLLTVASALGGKSPFLHPLDDKDRAASAHAKFSEWNNPLFTVPVSQFEALSKNPYFPYSDHLSVVRAFDCWSSILETEGQNAAYEFCRKNYLSFAVLEDIFDIRQQFRFYLEQSNLITVSSENRRGLQTYSEDLVRFALCAGLFPRVARVCMVQKYSNTKGKKTAKYTQKILDIDGQELFLHKSSVLSSHTRSLLGRNPEEISRKEIFLAFHKIIASPAPSMYDATSVSPVALLLFGESFSEIVKGSHRTRVILDGWIHLEMSELHAAIVRRVRNEIDDLLTSLVSSPVINRKRQNIINLILSKILSPNICN